MAQYQDPPMDLADASLLVVAESRTLRRVFTTDSDFYVYRTSTPLPWRAGKKGEDHGRTTGVGGDSWRGLECA